MVFGLYLRNGFAYTQILPDIRRATLRAILTGRVAVGQKVTVEGWVRTRREARGDLSFIHMYAGTTLAPLQSLG